MNEETEVDQQAAPQDAAPAKITVALLDEGGVYQGVAEIDAADLKDGDVHLPNGCDLQPGRYRWDAVGKTFVPLRNGPADKVREPDALLAIAAGLDACRSQGIKLPPVTLAWLDWYSKTWDGKSVPGKVGG